MVTSHPKSWPWLALLATLPWSQANAIFPDSREPIALEAASSEFDGESGLLVFRGIRISQGPFSISADKAEASELDFSASNWDFSGAVVIRGDGASILAEKARLEFRDHRLRNTRASGAPATFEREQTEDFRAISGDARTIEYDHEQQILVLSGDARLLDGTNEVSGSRLIYRVAEDRVMAGSDDGGEQRVRITITPPSGGEDTPAAAEPDLAVDGEPTP